MNDLRDRFRRLDRVATPDLWPEIRMRATVQPRSRPWFTRLSGLGGLAVATTTAVTVLALVTVTNRGLLVGGAPPIPAPAELNGVEGRLICLNDACEGEARPEDPSDWPRLLERIRAELRVVDLPASVTVPPGWEIRSYGSEWWLVTRDGERRSMGDVRSSSLRAAPTGDWEYVLISYEGWYGPDRRPTWGVYAWRLEPGD